MMNLKKINENVFKKNEENKIIIQNNQIINIKKRYRINNEENNNIRKSERIKDKKTKKN